MSSPKPAHVNRWFPLGDAGVVLEFSTAISAETHQHVLDALARLDASQMPGVLEIVPAYTTITLFYDIPASVRAGAPPDGVALWIATRALDLLSGKSSRGSAHGGSRLVEVPVCYGGEFGPDLDEVARHCGLSANEVVRRHASPVYHVCFVGFAPGFAYLGGLPPELATPRRAVPRKQVAVGSVGIAGNQTAVYPLPTPGGWQLIGRTPMQLFRPDDEVPVVLRIGDRVRFKPVSEREFSEAAR